MDEQRSKQEQIGELFKAKIDVKEESELLEELNNMEAREVEGQLENIELEQKVRAQRDKERNELEELERQLEEMTIATETEERKQQYAWLNVLLTINTSSVSADVLLPVLFNIVLIQVSLQVQNFFRSEIVFIGQLDQEFVVIKLTWESFCSKREKESPWYG